MITKLICGKCSKNFSIANGSCLAELKQKRNDKLEAIRAAGTDQSEKKRKAEQSVTIQLGPTEVTTLCPGKRAASSDVAVLLQENQLAAVFEFLKPDCQPDEHAKRAYTRSGKFAKMQR